MVSPGDPTVTRNPASRGRWRYAVPVMALGAGLLFGTSAALARVEPSATSAPADLAGLIEQRNAGVERLADRAGELSSEVKALERNGGSSVSTIEVSRKADTLAEQIGAEPVQGRAVRVTLDDAGYTLETLPEGYSVDDVVVHQQDVQGVVNALWAGGAEAMMIQDQRIIASSAVQCVGNTLYLQGRVYSPPYTITAIGDVDALQTSLEQDPLVENYRGWSDTLGLGYVVETLDTVQMPGFSGIEQTEHVRLPGTDEPQGRSEQPGAGPDDVERR